MLSGDTPSDYDDWGGYGKDWEVRDYLIHTGDDLIKGGDNITGDQYIEGGYGNDIIYSGSGLNGGEYVIIRGDLYEEGTELTDFDDERGQPNDGDDIIDVGDYISINEYIDVYSQGGND